MRFAIEFLSPKAVHQFISLFCESFTVGKYCLELQKRSSFSKPLSCNFPDSIPQLPRTFIFCRRNSFSRRQTCEALNCHLQNMIHVLMAQSNFPKGGKQLLIFGHMKRDHLCYHYCSQGA